MAIYVKISNEEYRELREGMKFVISQLQEIYTNISDDDEETLEEVLNYLNHLREDMKEYNQVYSDPPCLLRHYPKDPPMSDSSEK